VEREREYRPPDRHPDQRVGDVIARRAPEPFADVHVDPLGLIALLGEDRVVVLAERLAGRLRRAVRVVDRHLAVDRRVEGGSEADDTEGRREGDEHDGTDGERLVSVDPTEAGTRAVEEAVDETGERGGHTGGIWAVEQVPCPPSIAHRSRVDRPRPVARLAAIALTY